MTLCPDNPTPKFGEALRNQVEERLNFFATGEPPTKNAEALRKVLAEVGMDIDEDDEDDKENGDMDVDGASTARYGSLPSPMLTFPPQAPPSPRSRRRPRRRSPRRRTSARRTTWTSTRTTSPRRRR